MQHSVLKTKIAPPRYTRPLVQRARAIERLRDGLDAKLTIIRSPAGYGKTTLGTLWRTELISLGRSVAWLGLDEQDDILGYFIQGLGEAIYEAGYSFARDNAELYRPGASQSGKAVIVALVNDMASTSGELHVILDDLHCIKDPEILSFLSQLITQAPSNMHFIVISRTEPEIPLSALRLRGQLHEIDITELRFDFEEARDLLQTRLKSLPDAENLRMLFDSTEGWATAIQWASVAASRSNGDYRVDRRFSENEGDVFSSFPREVLGGLPEDVARFLLQTSILARFNVPLAQALTGNTNSADIIDRIERENFPLLQLEGEPGWCRYHPLFCSLLREQLLFNYCKEVKERHQRVSKAYAPQMNEIEGTAKVLKEVGRPVYDLFDLHRRAAEWHHQMGITDQAVHHYLCIDDISSVLELLESCTSSLLEEGRMTTMMGLASRLPKEAFDKRHRLKLNLAWCYLLTCHIDTANEYLEELSSRKGPLQGMGEDELIATKMAFETFRDDSTAIRTYADQWQKKCDPFHLAAGVNAVIFERILAGQYEEARQLVAWVEQKPELRSSYFPYIYRQCLLALSYTSEGCFEQANKIVEPALELAEQKHGRRSVPACVALAVLTESLYEQNRFSDLSELLANRFDVINESVYPDALIRAYINGARAYWALDNHGKSSELLDMLYTHGEEKGHVRVMAASVVEKIRQALSQNRFGRAQTLQAQIEQYLPSTSTLSFDSAGELVLLVRLSRARVDLALARLDPLLENLNELCLFYKQIGRRRLHARLHLMRAAAKLKKGDYKGALDDFVCTLEIGESCGFIRYFLDERRTCESLLKQFAGAQCLPQKLTDYLERILAGGGLIEQQETADIKKDSVARRNPSEKTNLSPKELEIVRCLGQGLPNKRIALAMDISVETVRWHMKNIFSKLRVNDRHDAANQARIIGLI